MTSPEKDVQEREKELEATPKMPCQRRGSADQAAEVLDISRPQLDRARAAGTYVVDHQIGGGLRPLTSEEAADRRWLRSHHLVAPAYFASSLPGRPWVYDLLRLWRQEHQLGETHGGK